MVRNLRCTVTIDSVLANSKTQNTFLFTVHAIFRHDYPLAVEPASTPRPLVQKKLWEILYLLICSFLPCLPWLLRSRVRKFRRDLRITLYTLKVEYTIIWAFTSTARTLLNNNRPAFSFIFPAPFNFTINHAMYYYYHYETTSYVRWKEFARPEVGSGL